MTDINAKITSWLEKSMNKAAPCKLCKGKGTIRGGNVTCPDCKGKKSVTKGDVDGHPFHGNQWSSGDGEINDKKDQIRRLISSGNRKSQIAQRTARRISNLHGDIAGKLADAGKLDEAQAHLKAADGWGKLARPPIEGEPNAWGEIGKPETNPVNMSDHALNDFEPWMNKSAEILKYETAGHAFNGNQWTHAERALGVAKLATRIRNSAPVQENYRKMADRHMVLGIEMNERVRQAQAGGHQDSQMVKDGIRGAQLAANAHFAAAKAYQDIAYGKTPYAAADKTAQLDQAEALSHVAAMASNNPMGLGERANGTE